MNSLDQYDSSIDNPYDDISDIEDLSEEQEPIIVEERERAASEYDRIKRVRDKFTISTTIVSTSK